MTFPGSTTYPGATTTPGSSAPSQSVPVVLREVFYNGAQGGTPLDADAMNRIWDGLMQALLDQLAPRRVEDDSSISMGEMLLVDTSTAPVNLQAPGANITGSWGARLVAGTNPVTITAIGNDVLDEDGNTTLVLNTVTDDVVLSYSTPGHFTVSRRFTVPLPATATTYGLVEFGPGGDLVGPANAVTVPGKENTGVAASLLADHTGASDPHGDRLYTRQYVGDQITLHRTATDPHGDRSWAQGSFVPLSWFDANGQLLPSHTGSLSIISTSVVASQAAMLGLNAQTGDVAIRTDAAASGGQRTYILQGPDPSILANWTVMPALGAVSSVRGSAGSAMTGDVVLSAGDVGAAPANDSRITGAQQTSAKGQPNGYAGLSSAGAVPTSQLPAASTGGPGVLQLSGDLGGTWNSVTVPNKAPLMTPNPTVYTGAHTPILQEIAQYNAQNASIVSTLPAAPSAGSPTVSVLEVKNLTPTSSTNTVTFNLAGSDTIDYATNPLVLRLYGETRRLVGYQGNWTVEDGVNTLSGLDVRYLQIANYHGVPAGGATGYVLGKTGAADYAIGWVAAGSGTYSPIETQNTVAASGAAQTLPDVTTATVHDITLTANCTFTWPTPAAGKSFTLILRQDATGGRTVTWPSTLWPSATPPTLTTTASRGDILTFVAVQTGTATGVYAWSGAMAAKDVR